MKAEYSLEELQKSIKNPFYEKLNIEIAVPLRREVYQIYVDIAKQNGEDPEWLMRRCLTDCAQMMLEHD